MKEKYLIPQDQVYWYLKQHNPQTLHTKIEADVVIVGGGMAGLSAAQSFADKGCSVVLLEKNYCGSGASGKSSGFITPDSELNLSHLCEMVGKEKAKKMWEFVIGGVNFIQKNITNFSLECEYEAEDTLIVANSHKAFAENAREYNTRQSLGYQSTLYNKQQLASIITSKKYYGGISYSNSFGINVYLYCQAMKEQLKKRGVQIFEETPVIKVHATGATTPHGSVHAKHIVVCMDRFVTDLGKLTHDVYQAQTFLMISEPLQNSEIKSIFPQQQLMVWDTDLIYQYYRVSSNRLMVGGSDLISIFWGKEQHNSHKMYKKLNSYIKKHFPQLDVTFQQLWPGLIGVSKDIIPVAGFDPEIPNIYYVSGSAGLPWAAALGCYSADRILDKNTDFDEVFSFQRKFPVNRLLQAILGKRLTFALSNTITLFK